MKKLFPFLFVLCFTAFLFGQIWVQYWGTDRGDTKFAWGQYFQTRYDAAGNTYDDEVILDLARDATYLLANQDNDTLYDADTLYTRVILTNGDAMEGIFHLAFSVDSVEGITDAQADSLQLDVRKYFTRKNHTKKYFSPWYNIGGFMKSDTLYEFGIADSSWWNACNGIEFRVINRGKDADTLNTPNLGPYIR